MCCAALKSNEYAVKFRLFSLKGNRTYIGNVSHIYSRCKFAAGGCSEKLKCLQGARNSHKVIITRPYPGSLGAGVLENSAVSLWDWKRISDGFGPPKSKLPGADPARFLTRQRDDDTN